MPDLTKKTVKPPRLTEANVRAILKKNDKNKDNMLDWNEINHAFKELGAWCPPLRACLGILRADENGDGKISEAELKPLIDYIVSLNYSPKT